MPEVIFSKPQRRQQFAILRAGRVALLQYILIIVNSTINESCLRKNRSDLNAAHAVIAIIMVLYPSTLIVGLIQETAYVLRTDAFA